MQVSNQLQDSNQAMCRSTRCCSTTPTASAVHAVAVAQKQTELQSAPVVDPYELEGAS